MVLPYQGQIHADGDPCRGPNRSIADMDLVRLPIDLRPLTANLIQPAAMRHGTTPVKRPASASSNAPEQTEITRACG